MGRHYNAGYLAAVMAGTYEAEGVLRRVPPCFWRHDSPEHRSWSQGVVDAVEDQVRRELRAR